MLYKILYHISTRIIAIYILLEYLHTENILVWLTICIFFSFGFYYFCDAVRDTLKRKYDIRRIEKERKLMIDEYTKTGRISHIFRIK